MNTPFIWILIPFLCGIAMLFFRERKYIVMVLGVFLSLVLAIIALLVPIEEVVVIGGQSFPLINQVNIAGLQILMTNMSRPILILQFAFLAFYIIGTPAARAQSNVIPFSFMITALILCGISVKPTVFGILLFQPAIFLSALLLTPPGSKPGKGVLRFLIYQVLGMTFFLLAGWSISSGQDLLENPEALQRSLLLFGLGFSFLLAVFPLNTWITMLAENQDPFVVVFVIASFFGGYSYLLLSVLNNFSWLFEGEDVVEIMRVAGVLMVTAGGLGAIFHKNLGRLLGYGIVIEVGYSLLSIVNPDNNLFYAMLLPRIFALSVCGLGLSILRSHTPNLSLDSIKGMGNQFPVASAAVILAQFSLSGVPLLAGFPLLLVVWEQIASVSIPYAISIILGSMGLLFGSLRSFSALVVEPEGQTWEAEGEDNVQIIFLSVGLVFLFLMGIFPHWLSIIFSRLIEGIEMLSL